MRRSEKEIADVAAIEEIIRRSRVCRLAMCDGGEPYVVPLSFGYRDRILYFHSAAEGKKLDILRRNNRVCIEFDLDHEIVDGGEKACRWGMRYRSVMGFGRASIIDDPDAKREALDVIMEHYAGRSFQYADEMVKKTVIIRVEIDSMTGKQSGYGSPPKGKEPS